MRLRSVLLEQPWIYQTFHAVFSREKFVELERYLRSRETKARITVLDVGCGPGTNAFLFQDRAKYDYLGIDINGKYIERASGRFGLRFLRMNVGELSALDERYDLILINSVTHHLTDGQTTSMLAAAESLLKPDGECVVLDMVRPAADSMSIGDSLQRLLIRLDRGNYCRTERELTALLVRNFALKAVARFEISLLGVTLWKLRLFTGKSRASSDAPHR